MAPRLRPNLSLRPGLWSLALLAACSGTAETTKVEPPPAPAPSAAPANPELPPIDPTALAADNDKAALVPSPVETQKALEAGGIQTQLATLIPKHDFDMKSADMDHAAVRTGVVLADLLLTTKGATKGDIIDRLHQIATGMDQLGAGPDIQATLKDFVDRVNADAVTRDELLKEFDELSGVMIPELTFNGHDRVVPLIEAGSWLEGANLVARAVKQAGDRSAAEKLLKAPSVVDYFIKYVRNEGSEKAPEAVTKKLEESLLVLKGLAEKQDPLTDADIDSIITVTGDVLSLL